MIKQILGKIPRKPSKSPSSDSSGGDGGLNSPHPTSSVNNTGLKPSSANNKNGSLPNQTYEALPSFRDVPVSERQSLFIKKLSMCSVVFNFADPSANLREKDVKRQTLLELVDYISSAGNSKLTEAAMEEIVRMASANLFRTFSSPSRESRVLEAHDLEEEEPSLELAWPHVQIVYELLLRFVASSETDAKLAKRYVDHAFVLRLLDLFDSEDQRERDYLKTILHRIYGKFMVHRPFIRKAINNIFYRFILETEKHNGIAELLEILGSVINGFALPLKEEHKMFLGRALVPLHKPRCVSAYHQQLSYCIAQFVEKDVKLTETVIRGLLKYWPVSNSSKEVMFLAELEEVLEATQEEEFRGCMVPLFRQISRCINSFHFQVAERTLFLWNNDHIRNLIIENRRVILPIVLPALERNAFVHWNQAVQGLSLNVKKIFADADQAFFDQCLEEFKENEIKESETLKKRESSWKRLEEVVISEAVLVSNFVSSVAISAGSTPFAAAGN